MNAAVERQVVSLSWRYLPVILASSLIMLAWALIINNLGRRRYPLHWWAPGLTFVQDPDEEDNAQLAAMEEAEVKEEVEEEDAEEGELRAESDPGMDDEEANNNNNDRGAGWAPRSSFPVANMEPGSLESAVDSSPGEFRDRGSR